MLTPRKIHERVAANIVTRLASPVVPGAWQQSRHPYDAFGVDSPEIEHHGFAIGLPSTRPNPDDRQYGPLGVLSDTAVHVRWAHRLRADGAVVDTLDALDAEAELVRTIRLTETNPQLHLVLEGLDRRTSRDGLVFVGELRWLVGHQYPLQ